MTRRYKSKRKKESPGGVKMRDGNLAWITNSGAYYCRRMPSYDDCQELWLRYETQENSSCRG